MAMEQRKHTTPVQVRNKLKVKFPFESDSVDVRKPYSKVNLMYDFIWRLMTNYRSVL